jgi:hypothetical protein
VGKGRASEDQGVGGIVNVGLPPVFSELERPRVGGNLDLAQSLHELDDQVEIG